MHKPGYCTVAARNPMNENLEWYIEGWTTFSGGAVHVKASVEWDMHDISGHVLSIDFKDIVSIIPMFPPKETVEIVNKGRDLFLERLKQYGMEEE